MVNIAEKLRLCPKGYILYSPLKDVHVKHMGDYFTNGLI